MDRSAQNIDRSSESEIRNLRSIKFVFDVSPLEIIYNDKEFDEEDETEVFFAAICGGTAAAAYAADVAAGMIDINQIDLVIHAVYHEVISQYWSLKSDHHQLQLNSSCHDKHHRDHHHLRDDDVDEEMIMIACEPSASPPKTGDPIILLDRGVFASDAVAPDDDYIMSQLREMDMFYEIGWIFKREELEEIKRCIVRRISESKQAVLLAKPKTVRIRLDMSSILKNYYANPAAAASAFAEDELFSNTVVAEAFATHYPSAPDDDDDDDDDVSKPSRTALTPALRSSKEALETKILEEEDLISSSSSCCSVCLKEFRLGVDEIKKMPCSHVFHSSCLENWLWERNTCPVCYYKLPTVATLLDQYYPLPSKSEHLQKLV